MTILNRFLLQFAEHCAWRGFYLYWLGPVSKFRGAYHHQGREKTMLAQLTIDPTADKPHITIGFRYRWWGPRWERYCLKRIPVPFLRWRQNAGRFYLAAYRLSSRIQHGLDGRYGWGTGLRKSDRLSVVRPDRLALVVLFCGLSMFGGLAAVLAVFSQVR